MNCSAAAREGVTATVILEPQNITDAKEARLNAERLPRDFLVSVMMRYSKVLGSDRPRLSIKDYTGAE
jgi:hypothetical protein